MVSERSSQHVGCAGAGDSYRMRSLRVGVTIPGWFLHYFPPDTLFLIWYLCVYVNVGCVSANLMAVVQFPQVDFLYYYGYGTADACLDYQRFAVCFGSSHPAALMWLYSGTKLRGCRR